MKINLWGMHWKFNSAGSGVLWMYKTENIWPLLLRFKPFLCNLSAVTHKILVFNVFCLAVISFWKRNLIVKTIIIKGSCCNDLTLTLHVLCLLVVREQKFALLLHSLQITPDESISSNAKCDMSHNGAVKQWNHLLFAQRCVGTALTCVVCRCTQWGYLRPTVDAQGAHPVHSHVTHVHALVRDLHAAALEVLLVVHTHLSGRGKAKRTREQVTQEVSRATPQK